MTLSTDVLADAVRDAQDKHAALIVSEANEGAILIAYRAVMVALARLAVDSGEDEMQALYEIEDTEAAILACLARWGIDSELLAEVREAFKTDPDRALALAADLGCTEVGS